MSTSWIQRLLVALASLVGFSALAADYSISGFGTLGYAQSNRSYHYQRFINNRGSLRRDTVIGMQMDAAFGDNLGATVQVLSSPKTNNDHAYETTVAWAFLSWRPTNDWLIRAGKQRLPLYLYSQTYNVGVTYEFARLPTEMYSISPSNEFTGLSVNKTWELEKGELVLDGYWGSSNLDVRFWIRDGIPFAQESGAFFRQLSIEGGGFVLGYKQNESIFRVGAGRVIVDEKNSSNAYPVTYPFVPLFPGVGYFQVDSRLPGPGIPTIDQYSYKTVTLGADIGVGSGFRVIGELARSFVSETSFSTQSTRGYGSVLRKIGKWTPYITYAFLRSDSGPLDLYSKINNNRVPSIVPGAVQINASQRTGADSLLVYDQSSLSIGTSYALSPTSKIKAEWMRVRIGEVSSLVDAPPGSNIRNQNINVFSLSYSMVF